MAATAGSKCLPSMPNGRVMCAVAVLSVKTCHFARPARRTGAPPAADDLQERRQPGPAGPADPENLSDFAAGLYDKTETELDLLVEARRTPGRTPA
jgi:hypothetical protein